MLEHEISDTVLKWFKDLDYEYMIMHIILCYGLYHSNNFKWVWNYYSPVKKKGISTAVWTLGAFLGLLEIIRFMPYIISGQISYQKIFDILYTYLVVQVFVEPLVIAVHKYLGFFSKNANSSSNNIVGSNK